MAHLSFMLSRALAKGRAGNGAPRSRAEILAALLRKRAEAHRQGLRDQEEKLRDQIRWALPIQVGEDIEPETGETAAADWTCTARS